MRWTVAGTVCYATFATRALAAGHEAKIRTAAREGEAFDATGLPLSMAAQGRGPGQDHAVGWYEFAGPSAAVVRVDLGAWVSGERIQAIGGPGHARPVVVRLPAGGSLPGAASVGWNTVGHSPAAK